MIVDMGGQGYRFPWGLLLVGGGLTAAYVVGLFAFRPPQPAPVEKPYQSAAADPARHAERYRDCVKRGGLPVLVHEGGEPVFNGVIMFTIGCAEGKK